MFIKPQSLAIYQTRYHLEAGKLASMIRCPACGASLWSPILRRLLRNVLLAAVLLGCFWMIRNS
jgi:hypothetical protein